MFRVNYGHETAEGTYSGNSDLPVVCMLMLLFVWRYANVH